jgi:hypothetical protein
VANIRSFPNNQDEYIGAEEVMRWHHGRSSGVFGAEEKAAVAPVLDTMAVTVSDGIGWLTNDNGNGVVWWVDNESKNGSKLQLPVDIADAVLPRIDRVVVSWQTTNYVALPEVIILKGTPASNPVAPALTNDSVVRQISLAAISIPAGATAIDAYMITDERLDESVCGIVTEKVGVDTSVMKAQFDSFWAKNIADFEAYKANEIADFEAYMAQQKAAWEAFLAISEQEGIVPIPAPEDKGKAVMVNENGDGYTLAEIQTDIPVTSAPPEGTDLWIDPDDDPLKITPAQIGAAPKSYILHGTIDGHTVVTLTNFNWEELLAAANNPDVCVLMRLIDEDGAVCDFTMAVCDADEELATFYCYKDSTTIGVTVLNDGSIIVEEVAGFEKWTFTLEDGSTVTKAVYVG